MRQYFTKPEHLPFLEIRTTLGSRSRYAPHFHSAFSLGIILEGRTLLRLGNASYVASQGALVLIAPGLVHSCNPIAGGTRSYQMLLFEEEWFRSNIARAEFGSANIEPQTPVLFYPELFNRASTLVDLLEAPELSHERQLVELIVTLFGETGVAPMEKPRSSIPQSILSDCGEWPKITELALEAHMRRESYSRAFRRQTGLPPKAYQHCLRVEKGRELLAQGKSISETACELGYTDQSHFHRTFVKLVSATPGCYRKKRSHPYKN